MTTFILSQEPAIQINGKTEHGRLILDEISHGLQIATVNADPIMAGQRQVKSAWQVAREKIDTSKFEKREWLGWFVRKELLVTS